MQGTVLNDSGAEIRWASSGLLHYTAPGPPTARSYATQWPLTCPQSYNQMSQQLQVRDRITSTKYKLPEESKRVRGRERAREAGKRERKRERKTRGNGEKESL